MNTSSLTSDVELFVSEYLELSKLFLRNGDMSLKSIIALVVVSVLVEVDAQCDPHGHSDGCSPWWLPYSYKRILRPQCDKHDICYACGESFALSRERCDEMFHKNLIERCIKDPALESREEDCLEMADTMYNAVQRFGSSSYETPSLDWCDQDWVPGCIF